MTRFWNDVKTAGLLGGLMALCMLIGWLLGGTSGLIWGFMFGGVGNIVAFFFSDKIAIKAMRGQEITRDEHPWLVDTVAQLAARAEMPTPRVYVCPQEAPNAFATGRNPKHAAVAVTAGMLQHFPPAEIEGVLAHEIAHVKHRDVLTSTVAAVLAGMISTAAYVMMWFGGGRGSRDNPLGAVGLILVMLLAPLAAGLIQAAISRQREFAADSYGGELCGDPRKLAGALSRLQNLNDRIPMNSNPSFNQMFIMEPLAASDMARLFSTHPKTEDRIQKLMEQAAGR